MAYPEIIGFRNEDNDGAKAVELIIRPIWNEFYSKGADEDFPLIISSSPKSWVGINPKDFTDEFSISEEELLAYVDGFMEVIKRRGESVATALNTDSTIEASFADSALEDDDIKLSMYRSFGSLYDKWVSSSSTGPEPRLFYNVKDEGDDNRLLYDHFQFVNRGFSNIGGEAVIDITYLEQLIQNPTMSLYETVTGLLSKSNFDFFPLPSFINYRGDDDANNNNLKSMFTAIDNLTNVEAAPSFICMFVGGSSRTLDIPKNISTTCKNGGLSFQYGDDGFDIDDILSVSKDIKDGVTATAFKVAYGQDNQSHFKSLELDQAEYKETQESLLVLDQLVKPKEGGGLTRASKGNNLYDVHLTRSYTCTVESLGNMMIQPLMYFKLENVPLFHGTYLVTSVKHNISGGNAKTTFKGTRQPLVTVPLVTDALSLINISGTELSDSDKAGKDITQLGRGGGASSNGNGTSGGSTGGGGVTANFSATKVTNTTNNMVALIQNNGGFNGAPDSKQTISNNPITTEDFMGSGGYSTPTGGIVRWGSCSGLCRKLVKEAIPPLKEMINALDAHIQSLGGYIKHTMIVDGMLRSIETQQRLYDASPKGGCKKPNGEKLSKCGNLAASPGRSNHGWGIGIDWKWSNESGGFTDKNNRWLDEQYKWLMLNAPNYGFSQEASLRDGSGKDEVWHWVYFGTSIFDYMIANPTSRGGGKVDITWDKQNFKLSNIVKNPIDVKTGKPAAFNPKSKKDMPPDERDNAESSPPAEIVDAVVALYEAIDGIGTDTTLIDNTLGKLTTTNKTVVKKLFNEYNTKPVGTPWPVTDFDGDEITSSNETLEQWFAADGEEVRYKKYFGST